MDPTTQAIIDLIKFKPVEMFLLLGFMCYLFRKPLEAILPAVITKKFGINVNTTNSITLCSGVQRRVVYDFPEKIILVDVSNCQQKFNSIITLHRELLEEVVFNFCNTRLINKNFRQLFVNFIDGVIKENNIAVKIILPLNTNDLSEDVINMCVVLDNMVTAANTKTITLKRDSRCPTSNKNNLILFDDEGNMVMT